MEMVTNALLQVLNAFIRLATLSLAWIENGLRGGLDRMHVGGSLQTLIVAIVPLLFLALVFRLMGGILRALLIVVLVILLIHILLPVLQAAGP
jgi:hypothetical protein